MLLSERPQPICEFYNVLSTQPQAEVMNYTTDSFFRFEGRRFEEATGKVFIPKEFGQPLRGWFAYAYFIPHEYQAVVIDSMETARRLATQPEQLMEKEKKLFAFMTALTFRAKLGNETLQDFERFRNRTGQYKEIAIIELHGGGNPWVVGPTTSKEDILGTTQSMVDTFIQQARLLGRVFEHIILDICNDEGDSSLQVHTDEVVVYYSLGPDDPKNNVGVSRVQAQAGRLPIVTPTTYLLEGFTPKS